MRSRRARVLLYMTALASGVALAQLTETGGRPVALLAPLSEAWTALHAAIAPAFRTRPKPVLEPAAAAARPRPRPAAIGVPQSAAPAPILVATAPAAAPSADEPELPAEPLRLDPAPSLTPLERSLGAAFKDGMILTGSTAHRLILFTFDDGPDPATTPLLLDRLEEAGIKAVFFLVASRIAGATPRERRQAVIAREIVRRGHIVAGHTVDHVQMPLLDDAAALYQLTRTEEIFEQVFGGRPYLFRPPFGAHSQRIDQHLAARHYTSVLWNLGAGDFQVRTADDVYATWVKVFERREREYGDRGGIVLLHDTYPWSVDAFERIVSYLMRRNCELIETDEELFDIVDDLSFFYVPRGDARPEEEAPRLELQPELVAARQAVLRERTARRCKSLASAF